MSIKNLYPTIKPSLLLDFANTEELDPRITFTRTTTARYYDGKTTAKAEENLLLYSQEFNDGYWFKNGVTSTANTTIAPDGTSTADSLIENNANSVHSAYRINVTVVANTYVASFYAKANGRNWVGLDFNNGAVSALVSFDLANGVVGTKDAVLTASITSVGNGWYRCVASRNYASATTLAQFQILIESADNTFTYTGDGTSGLFLWGAQLEQRSAVSAYTPTTTQPITNYVPVLQTAAAGQARFDHNPITGESLGLLIEEQRTNLLQRSEEFDNAYWTKTESTVTSNTVVAPDGTLTGDKLVENTSSDPHRVQRTIGVTGAHTLTVYAKAAERTWIALNFANLANGLAYFNLSNGTLGTVQSGLTATITSVGNGWYRCSISATLTSTGQFPDILIATADLSIAYTGNGYSGIYLWGAQVEAGAFPTSYIPTVGSTVTRNADAASMTGTNFSSWYRADEGTLLVQTTPLTVAAVASGMSLRAQAGTTTGTPTNTIAVGQNVGFGSATKADGYVRTNNTDQAYGFRATNLVAGALLKTAFAYKANDVSGYALGTSYLTDTSVVLPVVDTLMLQVVNANGYWNKIAFYPSRLSDANLQALTT